LTGPISERANSAALPIAGKPRLAVTRLSLRNFRSYSELDFQVAARPIVLAGPNGAGKTNILDAISLLSPGRGLRGAKLADHVRRGPSVSSDALWAVAASVRRGGESYDVGTGLTLGPNGGERRQVRLNGAPAQSSAELGELIQMLWLTPAMDRLFIEGVSGRRKFLDRLVLGFDPGHARASTRYETAMRERLRLLRFGPRDPVWLDGLETEMAEAGTVISAGRAETVAKLNVALARRGEAGAFPAAQLALAGETDALLAEHGEGAPEALRERLARARIRDAEAGRTTFGPHLTDLTVRHTQKRSDARECSTGEQKALLVAIILADAWELAQVHDGHAPLLLLDEIVAHLDARRRAALFEEIVALGGQAWLTGTDIEIFTPLRAHAELFEVADSQPRLT
jgi:DNA replication and repair protein RecF